jgi:hypothetical protein
MEHVAVYVENVAGFRIISILPVSARRGGTMASPVMTGSGSPCIACHGRIGVLPASHVIAYLPLTR